MKKLAALCLAFAALLCAPTAQSRICFLADLDCQSGKFAVDQTRPCAEQNSSWIYESNKCETIAYSSSVCNDTTGNYFEEQGCIGGYTDLSGDSKHECTVSLSCHKCCPDDKVKCKDQYQLCTNNTKPSTDSGNDSCEDNEGIKFLKCQCDTSEYPERCDENGLIGDTSNMCSGDNGTWYKKCLCASGFSQTDISNIKCSDSCPDNCRLGNSTLLPGTATTYCWSGAECLPDDGSGSVEKCMIPAQSDFDKFWGGYDVSLSCANLTVNCNVLGYNSGTAGSGVLCKDGTEPFRCPFDHTQVYCESGIDGTCKFVQQTDCQISYFGSNCTQDATKCYQPTSCKTGYGKTVSECSGGIAGNWTLGSKDEYGCALCQCERTCANDITLIPSNATATYEDCNSCGETTSVITGFTCNSGYKKENNSCVKCDCKEPNKDNYYVEEPSDCDIYGNYEGCNSSGMVWFDESSYNADMAKYNTCVAECYPELKCSSGYALTTSGCGTAEGWKLSSIQDSAGCFKCMAKTCEDYVDPEARDPLGRAIALSDTDSTLNYLSRGAVGTFQTGNTMSTCYSIYECFSGMSHGSESGNDICGNVQTIINGVAHAGCGVPGSGEFCNSANGAGYYALSKYTPMSVTLNGKTFKGQCPETYCWSGVSGNDLRTQLESQGNKPDYITLCVNGKWSDHC